MTRFFDFYWFINFHKLTDPSKNGDHTLWKKDNNFGKVEF